MPHNNVSSSRCLLPAARFASRKCNGFNNCWGSRMTEWKFPDDDGRFSIRNLRSQTYHFSSPHIWLRMMSKNLVFNKWNDVCDGTSIFSNLIVISIGEMPRQGDCKAGTRLWRSWWNGTYLIWTSWTKSLHALRFRSSRKTTHHHHHNHFFDFSINLQYLSTAVASERKTFPDVHVARRWRPTFWCYFLSSHGAVRQMPPTGASARSSALPPNWLTISAGECSIGDVFLLLRSVIVVSK